MGVFDSLISDASIVLDKEVVLDIVDSLGRRIISDVMLVDEGHINLKVVGALPILLAADSVCWASVHSGSLNALTLSPMS